MISLDAAREALHHSGIRITPQRMMIIEALVGDRSHPSADEIFAKVQVHYPSLSLATVYHTLTLLAHHGLIVPLRVGKEGMRCDPETTPHAHAYCERCGKIDDVFEVNYPEQFSALASHFTTTRIEISIFGHCHNCRTAD